MTAPEPGTKEFAEACKALDSRPLSYKAIKRVFDIAFSAAVIVVGLVPCAVLCIAIAAETKGSPIYSQERAGRLGRFFRIYKFRSMVHDADDVEKYLNSVQLEEWNREHKVTNDPRITRLGSMLRRTSLAPVIIGTPGDGEPTKSYSHPENSSLDLQICERRTRTSLGACSHYTSLLFLSATVFRGQISALKRVSWACDVVSDGRVCAVVRTARAAAPLAKDWTVAA